MTQSVAADTPSATITGLSASAIYQFQVRSVDVNGKSDWSELSGNVTTTPQNAEEVKFTTKTKAVAGKVVIEEKAKNQLKADSAKISWMPTADVDSYVITYTVPSGMKGVPGTMVQLVIPKSMLATGDHKIASPFGDCDLAVGSDGKLTLAINGLRASASYKVSIAAKDAGGFTTKAVSATVKTAAVAPIKKLTVDKTKTKTDSVGFSITGSDPGAGFAVGGYIIQVYGPAAVKGAGPKLEQTLYSSGTSPVVDIIGLQPKTKYTIVVTATTADAQDKAIMGDGFNLVQEGHKLSVSKSVAITTKK
jgi:hypothetical protein